MAVLLVSAARAKDGPHPPALVHAFGQGLNRQHETMVNHCSDDPLTGRQVRGSVHLLDPGCTELPGNVGEDVPMSAIIWRAG